jgi:hypothetical protein
VCVRVRACVRVCVRERETSEVYLYRKVLTTGYLDTVQVLTRGYLDTIEHET